MSEELEYKKCNTPEELASYIKELADSVNQMWKDGKDDDKKKDDAYSECVHAITKALLSCEMLMAHMLGSTGFQHSVAQLNFLGKTRDMKHGFMIVDANKLLYPQYDLVKEVIEYLNKTRKELREPAKKLLEGIDNQFPPHQDVKTRWEEIANQ